VVRGSLTLGEFVAFNGYLAMLIWPTIMLGWILNLAHRGASSMERLNGIFEAEVKVLEPSEPAVIQQIAGEIELKSLSFGYGKEPVLKELSLRIKQGSRFGIVGRIGSGKSTLVRLIARLYPVPDGMIFIDGTEINRISLLQLRNSIGFVPQEGFLFSRTVAENIAYGKEGAGEAEIRTAARLASLESDVTRFPDGYATLVGERGITLSGGQKQRTAIARALLKNPPILILDDPLSAVDAGTEEEILSNLSSYYGNRTVIIVSHRISALRDCDMIIVLDNGRIVEEGNHAQLLAMGGGYAELNREQQIHAEIEKFRASN
jgi:ATP-binding cassette subfamily B protein